MFHGIGVVYGSRNAVKINQILSEKRHCCIFYIDSYMEAGPLKRQENGKEDGFIMNNIVGKGVTRVDAYAKVTGEAKYTSDLEPRDCLCARVVHSTIANGLVKRFDLEDALKVPGV